MPGNALIGNLAVNLSMETAAFQRSATIAEKRVATMKSKFGGMAKSFAGGFGLALAGGAVAAGIQSVVSNAFQMGSALSEASEKLGVTVEGLQRLRLAAQQTGVSNEQLDSALTKLNKSLGSLQLGSASAEKSFAKIGLSAADLKGKKPDEALRLIADALNKLPDPQQRIAVGSELMGRGFAQLIPLINGGSAALDKYAQQSQKNGEISTQNAQKLDELADRWDGFKVRVGVAAANIIAGIAGLYDKVNGWLVGLGNSSKALDAQIASMARNAVQWVTNMVSGIGAAITGRLNAIWEGAKEKIESVKKKFAEMYDAVVGHSYIPDMIAGIASSMAELQRIMVDPSIKATDKVAAAFQTLGQIVGSIFGHKAGGIISAIGQFAQALAPLFGKNPIPAVPTQGYTGPAMARGGGGTFGGRSGVDKNILSLNGSPIARVSKGEHFRVSPANQNGAPRVQIVPSPYFDVVVDGRAVKVAAPLAERAAMVGASGGHQATMQRQHRQFP